VFGSAGLAAVARSLASLVMLTNLHLLLSLQNPAQAYAYKIDYVNYSSGITVENSELPLCPKANVLSCWALPR
jgi:hypothetical protein